MLLAALATGFEGKRKFASKANYVIVKLKETEGKTTCKQAAAAADRGQK